MRNILVTDGDQRSSLAVVRSLGRAGYAVEVCSAAPSCLAGASKYSRAVHRIPDPGTDPKGFLDHLTQLVVGRSIDILLPMTDVTASVALGLRAHLPELLIPFPSHEVWNEVSDKKSLMDVAAQLSVPVPRQLVIGSPSDEVDHAEVWARRIGYPVVIKPHRSAVAEGHGLRKLGVRIVSDEDELAGVLALLPSDAYPIMVQERIKGPGLGAFFLARDGEILASFGHRRLREKPATGGVSVLRESAALRSDLLEYSRELLGHFGWSGVAMVEFKEDESTGAPYLMEINGRFWGSLQLAIDAGVDFPDLLIRSTLGEELGAMPAPRTGVRSRWFWGEIDHLIWFLRAPKGYRDDHPYLPTRVGALARLLTTRLSRTRFEVLRLSDPKPFVHESVEWLRHVITSG